MLLCACLVTAAYELVFMHCNKHGNIITHIHTRVVHVNYNCYSLMHTFDIIIKCCGKLYNEAKCSLQF